MGDFKRLLVWQRSRTLVRDVYRQTRSFPASERFGLTAQLRRAAVSVAANIAEGAGKKNDREFGRYLRIARGSLHELECELLLSVDVGLLAREPAAGLLSRIRVVSHMLGRLIEVRTHRADATRSSRPLDPSTFSRPSPD
jgi:four helix bundle protein